MERVYTQTKVREGPVPLPSKIFQGFGSITDSQLAAIAEIKMPDLNTDDIEMAKRQVAGTARSMGVRVAR